MIATVISSQKKEKKKSQIGFERCENAHLWQMSTNKNTLKNLKTDSKLIDYTQQKCLKRTLFCMATFLSTHHSKYLTEILEVCLLIFWSIVHIKTVLQHFILVNHQTEICCVSQLLYQRCYLRRRNNTYRWIPGCRLGFPPTVNAK